MDYCLVVLTDLLYLPGTRRAVASWIERNGECQIVVLSREPQVFGDPFLHGLGARFVAIDAARYAEIRPYKKRHSRRHAETFFKFEAFADFGFARNVYLDSDALCLRPAPALAAPGDSPLRAVREPGFRRTRSYRGSPDEINSGVLSIGRALLGAATIERLLQTAQESPGRGGYDAGDQGILNKWIRRDGISLELLPPECNLVKKDYADLSGMDDCRILHFAGRKPWFERGARAVEPLERLWLSAPP